MTDSELDDKSIRLAGPDLAAQARRGCPHE